MSGAAAGPAATSELTVSFLSRPDRPVQQCILSPSSTRASRVLGRQLGVFSARHTAPFIKPERFQQRTNICREMTLNFLLPQASQSSASAHQCEKASSPQHPFPPQAPA